MKGLSVVTGSCFGTAGNKGGMTSRGQSQTRPNWCLGIVLSFVDFKNSASGAARTIILPTEGLSILWSLRKGIGYVDAVTISEKMCLLMIRSQNGHPSTYNVLEGTIHLLLHLNNSNRDLVIRLVLLPNLHIIYLII